MAKEDQLLGLWEYDFNNPGLDVKFYISTNFHFIWSKSKHIYPFSWYYNVSAKLEPVANLPWYLTPKF